MSDLTKLLTTALMVPMGNISQDPKNCKMGLPVILWGPPGIGKSQRVEQASYSLGLPVETIVPSTRAPEDVSGVLVPDGKGNAKLHSLLPGIERLIEDKHGVLFLDELSCARKAVQDAFLMVVLERRVGDQRLPPGVRILAAANDTKDMDGGWELTPPMANRLCHINVEAPTWKDWIQWRKGESQEEDAPVPKNLMKQLQNSWDSTTRRINNLMHGFLNSTQGTSLLNQMPSEESPDRNKAWPSSRSWDAALRAYTTCEIMKSDETIRFDLMAGCVGKGACLEFFSWVSKSDLPDPETALRTSWEPDVTRLDRSVTIYGSMVNFFIDAKESGDKVTLELLPNLWGMLATAANAGIGDIILPYAKDLTNAGLGIKYSEKVSEKAADLLVFLTKSGLTGYLNTK